MSWIVKLLAIIGSFIIIMAVIVGFIYVIHLLPIDSYIKGFIGGIVTMYLYLVWLDLFSAIWDD